MDIDIREHIVWIKYDKGQEVVSNDIIDVGRNANNELISLSIERDKSKRVVSVKVKFVKDDE